MKLSIITARYNRPWYNRVELETIAVQNFPKDELEIIVVDESTNVETPKVFKEFSSKLQIDYTHTSRWRERNGIHVSKGGRVAHSIHLNYALKRARGEVIHVEAGEFVHIGRNVLSELYNRTTEGRIVTHGRVRDVQVSAVEELRDDMDTNHLLVRDDVWGQWFADPVHTPLYNEMAFSSVGRKDLMRIGGFDEIFMVGRQCEVGEVLRRLIRSGCNEAWTDNIVAGHIEHPRRDNTTNTSEYRAAQINRRLLDQGYWEFDPKVKYYRPGTEKTPLIANRDKEWGVFPSFVKMMNIDEAIDELQEL